MNLVPIILILLIAGFFMWLISTAPIPIHPWVKTLIMGVVAFAILVWLLQTLGFHTGLHLN